MTAARSILILGGSRWQVDLIRRASALGLRTIVADISADAPGRQIADEFVQVDTNDAGRLAEVASTRGVSLVLAEQTDRTVPVAAAINERLGLPGIRPETALRFTNKFVMRQALAGSGVPMPRYAEVFSADEAKRRARAWGYPVVVKPKSSQSSFGVFKATTDGEIERFTPETLRLSNDGAFLVEEFVEGTEITVEALALDGRCTVLAVSEKSHYSHNDCVARRLAYPPRFDEALMARIHETAARAVEWLGLENGMSHGEYRLRDGIPHLVEVAARGGGTRIASIIVPHVSGIDMYEVLIRKLLGDDVSMRQPLRRAALLEFLDFGPGKVARIAGLDAVRSDSVVHEIELAFREGDTIRRPQDDKTRLGYFILLANTRDEIDRKSDEIKSAVRVVYDNREVHCA